MTTRHYTASQLLTLRASPLVQKPEHLPAIEQWIDESQQPQQSQQSNQREPQQRQNGTTGRQQRPGAESSPMGSFSTGSRPGLTQTRSAANKNGDDITLGPPKTLFASSRTTSRLSDFVDKPTPSVAETAPDEEQDSARGSRFFGEKQMNRKSVNSGDTEGRHNRESWTQARERRAQGVDEDRGDGSERNGRYGRRDREKENDGERRNGGFGDRQETRWGPRDEKRQNGDRQGGWREREKERREKDPWERHAEKEPEWMDDPAPKQEEDFSMMSMPRNQEDFEKWKQAQHARYKKPVEETDTFAAEPPVREDDAPPTKQAPPLKLEGVSDKPLGGWGEPKKADAPIEGAPTPAKSGGAKSKTSRFMPMFKKDEPREEQPPPAEMNVSEVRMDPSGNGTEDKEGFQRILQMLGGTGISQSTTPAEPSSPPPKTANGTRSKSRFTGFFDQTPKSPEGVQSPPSQDSFKPPEQDGLKQLNRGFTDEPAHMFGGRLPDSQHAEQPSKPQVSQAPTMSPDPILARAGPNGPTRDDPRPASMRTPNDLFLDQPPPRSAMTPDINIQNLLATQRNQRQGPDKNSEFLLNLLQTKGSSRPPSQHSRPDGNFALWLDQPQSMPETYAPKPRATPQMPGLYEEHLMRNNPTEAQRHDPHLMQGATDMAQRRTSQRAPPPGFFDEQNLFLQQQHQQHPHQHPHQQQAHQQRRNFTEPPQQHPGGRRMSGHPGLPPMQIPQQPPPPFPPGDFIQSPTGHPQAPPPGFNPHMPRHPPGFHNTPNIFQAPQQQQPLPPMPQQQPQRDLPAFGGNGLINPPNAAPPPGFYQSAPPQGYPPGFMQMRSPTEGMVPGGSMRGNGRGFEGYDTMGPRR